MRLEIHLVVDPRGWATSLDPEVVASVLAARLPPNPDLDFRTSVLDAHWVDTLPRGECIAFVFLTDSLEPGWNEPLAKWINSVHQLYALYTDSVPQTDHRTIAQLTVKQKYAQVPHRIVQQNAAGIERACEWMAGIILKLAEFTPAPPPVRITPSRWQNLPSNRLDTYATPDTMTISTPGAGGFNMIAASFRGKTHAHQGSYREDAVAIAATPFWNIMAVADGAGTAPLARVGSNTVVKEAIKAIQDSAPALPTGDDIGLCLIEGIKAARGALQTFSDRNRVPLSDLHTTLLLMIHCPQKEGCLLGLVHVGDGIITAETEDRQFYMLTEPDTDPDDGGRTLFLTSGSLRTWIERAKIYQFPEQLEIIALMTDGLSGDLEPYNTLLQPNLFEALRNRVLCYPLKQREQALMAFISYERRGSFDDRTLAVLSLG